MKIKRILFLPYLCAFLVMSAFSQNVRTQTEPTVTTTVTTAEKLIEVKDILTKFAERFKVSDPPVYFPGQREVLESIKKWQDFVNTLDERKLRYQPTILDDLNTTYEDFERLLRNSVSPDDRIPIKAHFEHFKTVIGELKVLASSRSAALKGAASGTAMTR